MPTASQVHPVHEQRDIAALQIDAALKYVGTRGVAVQAGARVGLWPMLLAERFAQVIALEPESVNYRCTARNLDGIAYVTVLHAALGRRAGQAWITRSAKSDGLHHIALGDSPHDRSERVAQLTLDDLGLERCDAIFLDVEGVEIDALRGATYTLAKCRPVVVVEENGLCARFGHAVGDLERFMEKAGFDLAERWRPPGIPDDGRFRGADLIFTPRKTQDR